MGRMGGRKHLKRLAAPAFWPILRKEYKWIVKPSPGPHPIDSCLPLLVVLRDVLECVKTAREARKVIGEGKVKVDGIVRRDYKFPVGLMDVLEVEGLDHAYRFLPAPVKHFILHPIPDDEKTFKIVRIKGKTTVKGGHIQLNLHDGRNILVRVSDPKSPVEDVYKTYDSLLIKVPDQEIQEHLPLREGAIAIISSGRNVGRVGRIKSIHRIFKTRDAIVTLEDKDGEEFQTALKYVYIIGVEEPKISLPEGAWK